MTDRTPLQNTYEDTKVRTVDKDFVTLARFISVIISGGNYVLFVQLTRKHGFYVIFAFIYSV